MIGTWSACIALGLVVGWAPSPPTRLDFLSVGQGDCCVFQTGGSTILIDAGPKTPRFDAGEKVVLPDLDKLGANSVDLILLSHPDEDHVGGVGAIHQAFPKARVVMSDQFRGYPAMEKHLRSWGMTDDDVMWLGASSQIAIGDFTLQIKDPILRSGADDNEGSMFIHLVGPNASAVFSGDADDPTEQEMEPLTDWRSQVMKVSHHGSDTSSDPTWLAAAHPQYAVISCGLNNQYHHPAPRTLTKLNAINAEIFRTDLQGDIEFDYDSKNGFSPIVAPSR